MGKVIEKLGNGFWALGIYFLLGDLGVINYIRLSLGMIP